MLCPLFSPKSLEERFSMKTVLKKLLCPSHLLSAYGFFPFKAGSCKRYFTSIFWLSFWIFGKFKRFGTPFSPPLRLVARIGQAQIVFFPSQIWIFSPQGENQYPFFFFLRKENYCVVCKVLLSGVNFFKELLCKTFCKEKGLLLNPTTLPCLQP